MTNTVTTTINSGGQAFPAADSAAYSADDHYTGGRVYSTTAAIAGTVDDALYQTERYGNLQYSLPVANGDYEVTLQFAENWWNAAGKRVFDVFAEGALVLDDFDIWATAGGKNIAHDVVVPVSVTDGALDLKFTSIVDNAKIGAIRVEAVNASPEAMNDTAGTQAGVPASVAVLANDSDTDGDTLEIAGFTQAASGTVTLDDRGTEDKGDDALVYTPNHGFTGTDTFDYTVSDGKGGSDTAKVSVTVNAATQTSPEWIVLRPGDDIAAALKEHPENTTFWLTAGEYRGQHGMEPKDGQRLIGEEGAVLNGSTVLTQWTKDGDVWHHDGLPAPMFHSGRSSDGEDTALLREDLFINDTLYQRVGSKSELGAGKWFYENGKAFIVDDPRGKLVEYSGHDSAITGSAANVVIENIVVEKYATRAQVGAIDGKNGTDWTLTDVEAYWNHGRGLSLGEGMTVKGGAFSHNGQLGIGGIGSGAVVDGVEVAHNNYAGFSYGWEAGGIKFVKSDGLVVRNSYIHDNVGVGIWGDWDNTNILIENNVVLDHEGMGIQYECSYTATIRDNIVGMSRQDGYQVGWWASNILLQNSSGNTVEGNLVLADRGQGINVSQQVRKDGVYGAHLGTDNIVSDNLIVHSADKGKNGVGGDYLREILYSPHNQFEGNTYLVPDDGGRYWQHDGSKDWDAIQKAGIENEGRLLEASGGFSTDGVANTLQIIVDTPDAVDRFAGTSEVDVFVIHASSSGDTIENFDVLRDVLIVHGAELPELQGRQSEADFVITMPDSGFVTLLDTGPMALDELTLLAQ